MRNNSLKLLVLLAVSGSVWATPYVYTFTDVTTQMGLLSLGERQSAWCDFTNDGWVDLYDDYKQWINDAGQGFDVDNRGASMADGIFGDYDNDGWQDFFRWSNALYHNNHEAGFSTATFPSVTGVFSRAASWGDLNGDGFIDLYVGAYSELPWTVSRIFYNNAGQSFTMAWESATGPVNGVIVCDFDEDADLDIYVSHYRQVPNLLWRNDGTGFNDVAPTYGVAGVGHTQGSCWGDFDNDGHFDLFVGNFNHHDERRSDDSIFYRNLGPDQGANSWHFQQMLVMDVPYWQESYGTPTFGDYDNDGDIDLFFATEYAGDAPRLYRNDGNWNWTNVTADEGLAGLTEGSSAAWADYNNDGWLDLVTDHKLFKNKGGTNHWVKFNMHGDGVNIDSGAVGTQLRITIGNQILTRQVESSTGKGNQNDRIVHFGLGSNAGPVTVEAKWLDGSTQVFVTDIDQLVNVYYTPPAPPADCAEAILAGYSLDMDFNDDCYVDMGDLAVFLADWLRCNLPIDPNCEWPF